MPDDEAKRFLGIIEQRCLIGTNGAEWFANRLHTEAASVERPEALRRTLVAYREAMHTNEPVHTWEA